MLGFLFFIFIFFFFHCGEREKGITTKLNKKWVDNPNNNPNTTRKWCGNLNTNEP